MIDDLQGTAADHAHPVNRDAFVLPSRPVEEFVNTLLVWLENLLPGGIVWGCVRMGKTQAIRYVLGNSQNLFGTAIPCYLLSAWDTSQQPVTENRFYQELLYAIRYKLPESGTAAIKRRRAIDYLIQQTQIVGEHRTMLFVDEAQWFNIKQFRCLMDLHNQLKLADIRLIVILVGQPELVELKAGLRSSGKGHLVGRFMTGIHHFQGVATLSDLSRLLWAMDLGSEYPSGSGTSYTRHFLPDAFAAGFRLEQQSTLIWNTLTHLCADKGFARVQEFPMQGIAALIRTLLRESSRLDDASFTIEPNVISEVIQAVALDQIVDHLIQSKPVRTRLGHAA